MLFSTHQGALRFTSPLSRSAYARMMVYEISPPPKMLVLAELLARRMQERVGGRMWLAAHMRRGVSPLLQLSVRETCSS